MASRNVVWQGKLVENPIWFSWLREMPKHTCCAPKCEWKDFDKAEVPNEDFPLTGIVNQNGSGAVFSGEFEVRGRRIFYGEERSVGHEGEVRGEGIHVGIKKPRLDGRGVVGAGWLSDRRVLHNPATRRKAPTVGRCIMI